MSCHEKAVKSRAFLLRLLEEETMPLKQIDLKKNQASIARMLLGCTSSARNEKLDVSEALKRWRDKEKTKSVNS